MNFNYIEAKNQTNTEDEINYNLNALSSPLMFKVILGCLICLLTRIALFGQAAQHTDNNRDQVLRGSGRVNASTLAMEFDLQLGRYPGRGINVPISISYSSKLWRLQYGGTSPVNSLNYCYSTNSAKFAENTASGWTTSLATPYVEYVGEKDIYDPDGNVYRDDVDLACNPRGGGTIFQPRYVQRLILHLPSGEIHELRASDTVAANTTGMWEGTFYAADSSNIKYIQNSTTGVYKAQMSDGSFYTFSSSTTGMGSSLIRKAATFSDRNGNYTTYHDPDTTYPNGYWTDTLGRTLPVPLKPEAPASAGTQTYSIPGIGGTTSVTYTLHWKQLKGSTAGDSGLTDFNESLRYYGQSYFSSLITTIKSGSKLKIIGKLWINSKR